MKAIMKVRKNCGFRRAVREQMNRMHVPRLSEPVDPANALFQPNGVPRELEVYDEPAAKLQVQSLGSGIGGEQKVRGAGVERVDGAGPFGRGQSAMEHRNPPETSQRSLEHRERVAILGEHDDRLADAAKQPRQRAYFGLVFAGTFCGGKDGSKRTFFIAEPLEGRDGKHRLSITRAVVVLRCE